MFSRIFGCIRERERERENEKMRENENEKIGMRVYGLCAQEYEWVFQ
jgi:hypothetical protein